jgi:ABC-type nitrate/sulfonate/bicarbonate transport system permease component
MTTLSNLDQVLAMPADTGSRSARMWRKSERYVLPLLALVVLLAAWQAIVDFKVVNPLFIAAPTAIAAEIVKLFGQSVFWVDMKVSGEELVIGLGISIVLGITGGLIYGWYPKIRMALEPIINGWNAMPQIALVPVLILLLGIGIWSKVAMIVLTCGTTFWLNTAAGIESISKNYIRTAKSFCVTDLQIFRWVALPAAFPYMLSALRIGLGRALIAIVVAELYGSQFGIGHLLTVAANNYQSSQEFAALIVITAFGIICNIGMRKVEKWYNAGKQ